MLHASDHKENKSIDIYMDSCYVISSWLIVRKTILIKKNGLTCDNTTEEVLTTTNSNYYYKYPNALNPTFNRTDKVIQEKKVPIAVTATS